ncbi:MAG: hypothetical protein NT027_20330, partial [Proteobacteria bacterium]|nr:hypothetical protein [Pseudomonadota bacterium]
TLKRSTLLLTLAISLTACAANQSHIQSKSNQVDDRSSEDILTPYTQPMLRLWRGFKQNDVNANEFKEKVNAKLIPALAEIGPSKGLTAYIPALLPALKPNNLPDEIALIAYSSATEYQTIRSTPKGSLYGPLHFEDGLFAKELDLDRKSTSSVAEPWNQDAKIGNAYALGPVNLNWQKFNPALKIILTGASKEEEQLLVAKEIISNLQNDINTKHINGAIVLVEKTYIILLSSSAPSTGVAGKLEQIDLPIRKTSFLETKLEFNEGVNVQFDQSLVR